jgi:hypothetical protein
MKGGMPPGTFMVDRGNDLPTESSERESLFWIQTNLPGSLASAAIALTGEFVGSLAILKSVE